MEKLSQNQVCDSKVKYSTQLAVEYHLKEDNKGLSQDYYQCPVCDNFHIMTIAKGVASKRGNKHQKKDDISFWNAKKNKNKRFKY